jgi:hypothetical protein
VQGHLRGEALTFLIQTECKHCGQPIHIQMDSALRYETLSPGARPMVFAPWVDFSRLKDPSIIDAF